MGQPETRPEQQSHQRSAADHGEKMRVVAPILLRSEAAASSQIEHLTASARQIFIAELGGTGTRNAAEIVANTRSMERAIALSGELSPAAIAEMHRVLMDRQPLRHSAARADRGCARTVQEEREIAAIALQQQDEDEQAEVAAAWSQEVDRRIAEIVNGEAELVDSEETFALARDMLAAWRAE